MPFESKKQEAKCFALKARGQAGSWNCDEWAHATDQSHLPARKKKAAAALALLAKRASDLSPGTAARRHVPKKDFAMPASTPKGSSHGQAKGKYPMPDKRHAAAAAGFCAMHHGAGSAECQKVRAKAHAKFGGDAALQNAAGAGVVGAGGAGIGGLLGMIAGRMRGNTPEGLGRGILRGGATGLGTAAGATLGAALGARAGHTQAGTLAGAGLGGAAGYLGSGALMGPPESEREEEKYAAALGAAAADQAHLTKLAADMAVSPDLVAHLAAMVGLPPAPFVKRAYADPDAFIAFLHQVTKQAGVAELLGRLRGSLKNLGQGQATMGQRAAVAGAGAAATGLGAAAYYGGKRLLGQGGTGGAVPGAGEAVAEMHAPNPVAPMASAPAPLDASGGGGMAPSSQLPKSPPVGVRGSGASTPGKGLSPALKALLIGGGLGAGGLAAGAALRRRGRRSEEEKEAAAVQAGLAALGCRR